MKALCAAAGLALGLMGAMGSASSQPWGGPGYGYRDRDYGYRDRDYGYDEPDDEYRGRGRRYRERGFAFDEREYLRCHPDVRRAVRRGEMESGWAHYQMYGRREGRRLSC